MIRKPFESLENYEPDTKVNEVSIGEKKFNHYRQSL